MPVGIESYSAAQLDALHLTGKVPADTTHIAAWRLIAAQIGLIEARTFWTFVLASAGSTVLLPGP